MFTHFAILMGAVSGAILSIITLMAWLWRKWRKISHLIDDVMGETARPETNAEARPGWGQRLGNIEAQQQRTDSGQLHIIGQLDHLASRVGRVEAEFQPDHGMTMRDRVDQIEKKLDSPGNKPGTPSA